MATGAGFGTDRKKMARVGIMAGMRLADALIVNLDRALRAVAGVSSGECPPYPAAQRDDVSLAGRERRHAAGLMRVNHAGEVAAQALYHGQSLTARSHGVRAELEDAAREEQDHLQWCRRRLDELEAHPSRLDPLWYAGSFAIGALAGLGGDRVNLGFLAETERQVEAHLAGHLDRLPAADARSRAVVAQMRDDEARHARNAERGGGVPLPSPVRALMRGASRVMTTTAYWI